MDRGFRSWSSYSTTVVGLAPFGKENEQKQASTVRGFVYVEAMSIKFTNPLAFPITAERKRAA